MPPPRVPAKRLILGWGRVPPLPASTVPYLESPSEASALADPSHETSVASSSHGGEVAGGSRRGACGKASRRVWPTFEAPSRLDRTKREAPSFPCKGFYLLEWLEWPLR